MSVFGYSRKNLGLVLVMSLRIRIGFSRWEVKRGSQSGDYEPQSWASHGHHPLVLRLCLANSISSLPSFRLPFLGPGPGSRAKSYASLRVPGLWDHHLVASAPPYHPLYVSFSRVSKESGNPRRFSYGSILLDR